MVGDDLLCQYEVGLQQRLGCVFHGSPGQPTFRPGVLGQGGELLMVSGAHPYGQYRVMVMTRHAGELTVNGVFSYPPTDVGAVGDGEVLGQLGWGWPNRCG